MQDGADAGDGTRMDVQEAAVIMQEAGERARHAAGGAFAGPVGVWAVGALAGGLAFLLMAAIEPALRPS